VTRARRIETIWTPGRATLASRGQAADVDQGFIFMALAIAPNRNNASSTIADAHRFPEVGVPWFWPLAFAQAGLALTDRTLKFLAEVARTQVERPTPRWTTANRVVLELHTLALRDFSIRSAEHPVLVLPPYAGHASTIADFHAGQSLVGTLRENGCEKVFVADWRSATLEMRDYDIDNYLADLGVVVNDLGGKVALVGLCQGGWLATMYAARFPHHVSRLVLAGAPIDTDAGDGPILASAPPLPIASFRQLVPLGGWRLNGEVMLQRVK